MCKCVNQWGILKKVRRKFLISEEGGISLSIFQLAIGAMANANCAVEAK
jgi:hypothetical protein